MLTDPEFVECPPELAEFLGDGNRQRIQRGIYLGHLNLDHEAANLVRSYRGLCCGHLYEYGVCDSPAQLLAAYDFEEDPRLLCIFLTEIRREDEPETGGWRWHKWGPYIGKHIPQCEYLRDERGIDAVFVFHIYEVQPERARAGADRR